MAVLSFPKNGGSYNLLTNVAPPALACLGACTHTATWMDIYIYHTADASVEITYRKR